MSFLPSSSALNPNAVRGIMKVFDEHQIDVREKGVMISYQQARVMRLEHAIVVVIPRLSDKDTSIMVRTSQYALSQLEYEVTPPLPEGENVK